MHGWCYILHRVVDCESSGDGTSGRVDIQFDRSFRVFGLEEQQLRCEQGRGLVVNLSSECGHTGGIDKRIEFSWSEEHRKQVDGPYSTLEGEPECELVDNRCRIDK